MLADLPSRYAMSPSRAPLAVPRTQRARSRDNITAPWTPWTLPTPSALQLSAANITTQRRVRAQLRQYQYFGATPRICASSPGLPHAHAYDPPRQAAPSSRAQRANSSAL